VDSIIVEKTTQSQIVSQYREKGLLRNKVIPL
jgi:hypothetical protein